MFRATAMSRRLLCMDSNNRRIDRELGFFIYNCWKVSGMTTEDFADAISVGLRTLNYYFNGKRKPGQRTLLKLLKVSNVNLKDIPF